MAVEAILRLIDQASPVLGRVAAAAQQAERAVGDGLAGAFDAAGDAAAGARREAERLKEETLDAGQALGDLGDAAGWFLAAPAAIAASVAGIAAFTDAVQSARLELAAAAADAGLSREQVEALQAAARISGRSLGDLAEEYERLDERGRAAIDALAGATKSATDDQVEDAKRWKASIEDVWGVWDDLKSALADAGSSAGQGLIDGIAYASVVVSSIMQEMIRRIKADFELLAAILGGGIQISIAGLQSAAAGDLSIVQAAQTAALEQIQDALDRDRVEISESAEDVIRNAIADADQVAAAMGQLRQQRIAAAGALGGAPPPPSPGSGRSAPPSVLSGQGIQDAALLQLWQDMARNLEILALAPAVQGTAPLSPEALIGLRESDRILAGEAAPGARRGTAGLQAGLGIAGQVVSGDVAGLVGMASGPAGAAVGLLQQIGDMGADKIVAEIRSSIGSVAEGIRQLPDLIVGLVEALPEILTDLVRAIFLDLPRALFEALPEILMDLVRAIFLDLPRALFEALADWFRSIWAEVKSALNPFDGEGRARRQFLRGVDLLGMTAGGEVGDLLRRSAERVATQRDRRGAAGRAASAARQRSEVVIVREPMESRRLSARQAAEDAQTWRTGG